MLRWWAADASDPVQLFLLETDGVSSAHECPLRQGVCQAVLGPDIESVMVESDVEQVLFRKRPGPLGPR